MAWLSIVVLASTTLGLASADVALFTSASGVTSPVTRTFEPEPKLVEGLIQAGFPRARAEAALRAVGNENCCQPQMKWLFEQSREANKEAAQKPKSGQCHKRDNTDYDGYAVKWGGQNIQPSWEACCQSCRDYQPVPPNLYPCNIWVYCDHDVCFAPAAGEFTRGQCWLKYQEDPTNPHVNMKGAYTDEYRATHPTAPPMVAWTAGSIVEEGAVVGNGTWSSRSHWKLRRALRR